MDRCWPSYRGLSLRSSRHKKEERAIDDALERPQGVDGLSAEMVSYMPVSGLQESTEDRDTRRPLFLTLVDSTPLENPSSTDELRSVWREQRTRTWANFLEVN